MADAPKILFISAPIGSGHIRAAQSVQQALQSLRPEAGVQLANVFDFFPTGLGKAILNVYLKVLQIYPSLYGKAYQWGNSSGLALWGRLLVSRFLANRMHSYIARYNPDIIVCTHATPAGLVADLKQRQMLAIPCVAVITDFVVHRLWVYPEFTHYYVAHEAMRRYLNENGIDLSRSSVSGIPVMPQFAPGEDQSNLRLKLGLAADRKTILLMGGGAGLMPLDLLAEVLLSLDAMPLQLIVVAGHNQAMYQKVARLKQKADIPLLLYSYTDNVHELMLASDLLISKPGGVSSAEALAVGLPLVIYRPLPGVEQANTAFLTEAGAAVEANSLEEVAALTASLLTEPQAAERMKKCAAKTGRPEAATVIAQELLFLIRQ